MCLAQGNNTVTPVRLEPPTPQSGVKHSITELPLHKLIMCQLQILNCQLVGFMVCVKLGYKMCGPDKNDLGCWWDIKHKHNSLRAYSLVRYLFSALEEILYTAY